MWPTFNTGDASLVSILTCDCFAPEFWSFGIAPWVKDARQGSLFFFFLMYPKHLEHFLERSRGVIRLCQPNEMSLGSGEKLLEASSLGETSGGTGSKRGQVTSLTAAMSFCSCFSPTHNQLPLQYEGSSFLECATASVRGHPLLSSVPFALAWDLRWWGLLWLQLETLAGAWSLAEKPVSWKVKKVNTRQETSPLDRGAGAEAVWLAYFDETDLQ